MGEEYCCKAMEYFLEQNKSLTFKILEKNNSYYIDFFGNGAGHMNWDGDMKINYCMFCGARIDKQIISTNK